MTVSKPIVLSLVPENMTAASENVNLFDPSMKHLFNLRSEHQAPTFSPGSIIDSFSRDFESVSRISVPVEIYISKKNEMETLTPAIWESRGVFNQEMWALIIGNRKGQRPQQSDVLRVRHRSPNDEDERDGRSSIGRSTRANVGRRALVEIYEDSLVTMGMKHNRVEYILTYRVQSIVKWPEPQKLREGIRAAVANLELVAVYVRSQLEDGRQWVDSDYNTNEYRDGLDSMWETIRSNLNAPTVTPKYMEHFASISRSTSPEKREKHFFTPNCDVREIKVPKADHFLDAALHELMKYRQELIASGVKTAQHNIPASIQYQCEKDGEYDVVTIQIDVPSILPNYDSFSIMGDFVSIPASLQTEPVLTFRANTFDKFLTMVTSGNHNQKEVTIRI